MVQLTRRRQIAARVETTRGTAVTLTAGNNIPNIRDVGFTVTPLRVERNLNRSSLTKYPSLVPGQTQVELTFAVEMGGNSSMPIAVYNGPRFDPLLRACGLEAVAAVSLATGAITSGPFRHAETLSQGASNQGTCIGDWYTGSGAIYAEETSGAFGTSGNVSGATSGATVSPSGAGNDVKAYRLQSDPDSMEAITIAAYVDGKIVKVRGAMGNVEWTFQHGNPVLMNYTIMGVLDSYSDGALLTSPEEGQDQPPAFFTASTTFSLTDGTNRYGSGVTGAAGPLSQMTLGLNNNVVLRENALVTGGIGYAIITDRAPAGSFNPDEVLNSVYDFHSSFRNGTPNRMKVNVGSTAGNRFLFNTPGLVFSDLGDGDRDGIQTLDASFDLSGGDYASGDAELPGSDNEFVFIYH